MAVSSRGAPGSPHTATYAGKSYKVGDSAVEVSYNLEPPTGQRPGYFGLRYDVQQGPRSVQYQQGKDGAVTLLTATKVDDWGRLNEVQFDFDGSGVLTRVSALASSDGFLGLPRSSSWQSFGPSDPQARRLTEAVLGRPLTRIDPARSLGAIISASVKGKLLQVGDML